MKLQSRTELLPSSFRDPGAYVYKLHDLIYRQINISAYADYQHLIDSGLYEHLASSKLLVPHEQVPLDHAADSLACVVLKPEQVDFISYPYEWCFSQLKDAALLTLKINQIALDYGMILKDASAYNVQFHHGGPILIDTCSLEKYREGEPWIAYSQFCKHFLAPLALMAKVDIKLGSLSKLYIDGIPLDLTSRLLGKRAWRSFSLFAHIHAHARSQAKFGDTSKKVDIRKVSRTGLLGLVDNLQTIIKKLSWLPAKTEWRDYYEKNNYSEQATSDKAEIVHRFVKMAEPTSVWDLGGNNGYYSRIAAESGAFVVSWDVDPAAVEDNYVQVKTHDNKNVLPLIQDLTNPSPGVGWAHSERESLQARGPVDLVMALALLHHLAISNNVPLERIAEYFARLGRLLLIEFVPKEDSQVQRLLANRQDIFAHYNSEGFTNAFRAYYEILDDAQIENSHRHLYLMRRK